jgi:hypothetical protein
MNEEILIRMGLDHRAVNRGLATVQSKVGAFAASVGGMLTRGLGRLFGPLTAAGIALSARRIISDFEQAKQSADKFAESFGKLNDEQLGALETASQYLRKTESWWRQATVWLAGHIGLGMKLFAEFFKSGDLGGSALEMWLSSQEAGGAVREEMAAKKRAEQAKVIESFNERRERSELKRLSSAEKLAFWERKIAEARAMMERSGLPEKERFDWAKKVLDIEDRIFDEREKQGKEQAARDREALASNQRLNDLVRQRARIMSDLSAAKADEGRFTLAELAGRYEEPYRVRGKWNRSRWVDPNSPLVRDARHAQDTFSAMRDEIAAGRFGNAEELKRNYLDLVANNPALSDAARNPFGALEEQASKTTAAVEAMLDRAARGEFRIRHASE